MVKYVAVVGFTGGSSVQEIRAKPRLPRRSLGVGGQADHFDSVPSVESVVKNKDRFGEGVVWTDGPPKTQKNAEVKKSDFTCGFSVRSCLVCFCSVMFSYVHGR